MDTQQEYSDLKQEIEKLRLENVQLKKNLEKEEFFEKGIYKQWCELHALILSKENEVKQARAVNSIYKYGFYLILLLFIPSIYFLSSDKRGERVAYDSQAAASPKRVPNETLTSNPDTVKVLKIMPEQKEIVKQATVQTISATAANTVVTNPITDSARISVYWEGWVAYYEKKSRNPYPKSTQEYEAWLAGWKEGENDSKKTLAKNSF
jgi:hypothetical protein